MQFLTVGRVARNRVQAVILPVPPTFAGTTHPHGACLPVPPTFAGAFFAHCCLNGAAAKIRCGSRQAGDCKPAVRADAKRSGD